MRDLRGFQILTAEAEEIVLFYTELASCQYDKLPISYAKRLRPSASRCLGSQISEEDIVAAHPQVQSIITGLLEGNWVSIPSGIPLEMVRKNDGYHVIISDQMSGAECILTGLVALLTGLIRCPGLKRNLFGLCEVCERIYPNWSHYAKKRTCSRRCADKLRVESRYNIVDIWFAQAAVERARKQKKSIPSYAKRLLARTRPTRLKPKRVMRQGKVPARYK